VLKLAAACLFVAFVAALFGFGGITHGSVLIAQALFFVFIMLFVIAMVANAMGGKAPR